MGKQIYSFKMVRWCLIIALTMAIINCGGGGGRKSGPTPAPNTDTTPPTVSSTAPANGDTQVAPNSVITATFSEAIDSNTLLNNFIVKILGTSGVAPVSGTITYAPETKTVTFKPDSNLNINTTYSVTITTNIEDLAGNKMTDLYQWSFSTGAAIDNIPPSFSGNDPQLVAQATSTTSISLSWNAATDNATPANQIRYVICQSTSSTACNTDPFPQAGGSVVIYEVAAGTLSYGAAGLISNTTYYFTVRAKDLVGLIDGNIAQKSATTPGKFISLGKSLNAVCTGEGTSSRSCNFDATDVSIAIVGTQPYIAWSEGSSQSRIYIRTYNNNSNAWSAALSLPLVNPSGNAQQPKIISSTATPGVPYLTYTECIPNSNCRVYVSSQTNGTWTLLGGGALNIDTSQTANDSAISFDSNNTPYVIWIENNGSANQVYVKHFDSNSSTWIINKGSANQDSLNVDTGNNAYNPAIAIEGTTVKAAWSECNPNNSSDCQLYIKGWDPQSSLWTPSNPTSLKAGDLVLPTQINDPSLMFVNHSLYIGWHQLNKIFISKEQGGIFVPVVKQGSTTISDSASSSSILGLGATTTSALTQVPYLIYADTANTTQNTGPFLFAKRWDGSDWVTEDGGASNLPAPSNKALNMTGGGVFQSINSSITFSGGTPFVAWTEKGSCLITNGCDNNSSAYQVYVKKLQ